ncbi:MAG: tyrosine-type recombinase/integrase [Desulfotomaculales bacterium]
MLRHTCATNLFRSGYDLGTVADILGHANVPTTAIHTRPSSHDKARALAKRRTPGNRYGRIPSP